MKALKPEIGKYHIDLKGYFIVKNINYSNKSYQINKCEIPKKLLSMIVTHPNFYICQLEIPSIMGSKV